MNGNRKNNIFCCVRKRALFLCLFCLLLCLCVFSTAFSDVIFSSEYNFPDGSDLPEVLNLYETIDCGIISLKLTHTPLVSKSMNANIADFDLRYLILRVGITNNSEETIGWISPESFMVSEVYRNRIYGTYPMDPLMSAKGAKGYSENAFYSSIEPGATLQTILIFEVFPEADSWVLSISPFVFGEKAEDTVEIMLPKAAYQ